MNYLRKYATHATPRSRPELSNYRIGPKRKANERTLTALLDEIQPVRVRKPVRLDATECILIGLCVIAVVEFIYAYKIVYP